MSTWHRIDSNGRDWITWGRKRLADALAAGAQRLDPDRMTTRRGTGGGYTISVHGIDLARIDSGAVKTERPVR